MVDCSHCGNPVVTNGPLSRTACPSCLQTVTLPPDLWGGIIGDYLADYDKLEPGSGTDGTLMTGDLTVKYSCVRLPPPAPACPTCEENWDLESVENGADRPDHSGLSRPSMAQRDRSLSEAGVLCRPGDK